MRTLLSRLLLVVLVSMLAPLPATGQAAHRAILRGKLERDLRRIADGYNGVVGIEVVDLSDPAGSVGVNDTLVFPQGSAIKIPILVELFRQNEQKSGLLRERHDITAAARTGGSGSLANFTDGGSALSNEDLSILMVTLSDNTATNMLIDVVGMDAVNRMLDGAGFKKTRLQRKMIRPDASLRGEENVSTPAEAAGVMRKLARCELPLNATSCARVRQILELDKSEPVREAIPSNIRVASKPGDIEGVSTSWALVDLPDRPFVLTVMTNYGDSDAGRALIREVAKTTFDYFSRLARSTPNGARVPLSVKAPRP